jgi:hypothetical protein
MEQRPLRLGDIVDDYCPRERRITNHVIVALVGDAIRQTRCTTCDADHVYKAARMPRRKKPDAPAALYDQVLADVAPAQPVAQKSHGETDMTPALAASGARSDDPDVGKAPESDPPSSGNGSNGDPEPEPPETGRDVWAAHRPLIRATLPRTENDPPTPRPIPEFTMHQRRTRGGHGFRQSGWQGQGNGNSRPNGFRHGRSGQGQGQNPGNHGNGPGPHRQEPGGRSGRRHGSKNKRPR